MTDRLSLSGVRCNSKLGVPDWEREKPQPVEFDAVLEVDLQPAGESDDLTKSVDYHALEQRLRKVAESGERKLLENLAEELAAAALKFDSRIEAVTLRARKKPAVMPKTAAVAVEIRRAR